MPNILTLVEGKRGCGYRKEGGFYLMLPEFKGTGCGKLPLLLETCPCCGAGVKHSRGWTWINGKLLFKDGDCLHVHPTPFGMVRGYCISCILSHPPEKMGLLWIGQQFYKTPEDWVSEGQRMGISRRIKGVPHGFKLGETWVAVAHVEAIPPEPGEKKGRPGIFQVFKPSIIDYVVKKDDTEEKLTDIEKRGIRLVKVVHEQKNLFGDNRAEVPTSDN